MVDTCRAFPASSPRAKAESWAVTDGNVQKCGIAGQKREIAGEISEITGDVSEITGEISEITGEICKISTWNLVYPRLWLLP